MTYSETRCGRVHNILILENELVMGGLEKKLYDFVSRVDTTHYRISVCCLKLGGYFKEAFVDLGTPFYDGIQKSRFDALALARLMRIIDRERIDLIYTVPHPNTLIFSPLAKLAGGVKRIVVSIHGTGGEDGGRMFKPYQKPFLAGVDRFIAVADRHRQYLRDTENLDASKIDVIHNGVDLETFRPGEGDGALRDELGIDGAARVVTTVATLKPLKRIDLLLDAAKGIMAANGGVQFVIVGDGAERGRLQERAARLGIGERVIFAGFREDVDKILRLSDLFVLPSRTEAFPNVVLEAMASGLPVVATDVGSVVEMVEDGHSGILVPPGDVDALRTAIGSLLADPGRLRACGARGRRIVEQEYALERMCSKREALFSKLLCGVEPGRDASDRGRR
ncbi:MAG: glycosyltransferase family 4 protein [Candidatus Krumholzibacteriia bacterium]